MREALVVTVGHTEDHKEDLESPEPQSMSAKHTVRHGTHGFVMGTTVVAVTTVLSLVGTFTRTTLCC